MNVISRRLISVLTRSSKPKMVELRTIKLENTDGFRALFTPELEKLSELFNKNGFEIRMAGGAVRDLLMGARPSDVDFATDATPTQMNEMFTREHIRMLHKRGEEHGTVTCRLNDRENFEITTLRVDVVCDGRRAAVEFTKDWGLDAFRRDLTINSLFLGLDGIVYDYTDGIEDIKRRRIAFVGEPKQRLQEDYLRILRYFRFFGRFASLDAVHDPKNIDAIVQCRDGIKGISGERIWMELHRILVGRLAAPIIRAMLVDCGLGPFLAVHADRVDEFERIALQHAPNENDGPLGIEPSTALSALFAGPEDAQRFQTRCKCSNAEKWLCEIIVQRREEAREQRNNLRYFKQLILDGIFDRGVDLSPNVKRECVELMKYVGADANLLAEIEQWEADKFPVGGLDLLSLKVPKGPRMKCTLRHMFNLWKQSELSSTRDDLLKHIEDPEIAQLEEEGIEGKKKKPRRKRPFEINRDEKVAGETQK